MEKFEKLGLSPGMLKILKRMGFQEPSEIQEKSIPIVLSGKDIIAASATGSGKTFAFAAPIIENIEIGNEPRALILTPTRELAEQVAESIQNFSYKKLNVTPIYGGMNISKQIRELKHADIVVGTPGRILDHLERRTLDLGQIKFLVLDEFDRMLDMGFSKDVGKIIKSCPKERQTMLFSATISPDVEYLVNQYTTDPVDVSVKTYVDDSKLKQVYYDVPSYNKFSLLVHLLKNEDSELIMIFCGTRRNVDFIVKNLNNVGIHARAIHGGLEQKKRSKIMKDFDSKKVNILVCTDIAARGIDVKGISHVYNYDLPTLADDYVHRIGRTARAGTDGKVINILSERDYDNFTNILRRKSFEIEQMDLPKIIPSNVKIDFENKNKNHRFENKSNNRESSFSRKNNRRNTSKRERNKISNRKDEGRSKSENNFRLKRKGNFSNRKRKKSVSQDRRNLRRRY